jgi:hypothetical protein
MTPEIINDSLSSMLTQLAARDDVKTLLEVGSGDGSGSTQALISGLKSKADARIGCLETRLDRMNSLSENVSNRGVKVVCLHSSSVPVSRWMTEIQVRDFYQSHLTALNQFTIEEVIDWRHVEIMQALDLVQNGIEWLKSGWEIQEFDLVLLDGCPFCGVEDLKAVIGSKIIVLDDVNCIKNYENFRDLRLYAKPEYELVHLDMQCRNGWAVFVRKDTKC